MINVHGLRRNVKNVVRNYSDAQIKVREATSNDPWGPSGTLMSEIADLTYNVVAFSEIMQVVWKRLNDHGKNWKHVYKALVLLEYLIKTGSEKVTHQCKENIFSIQTLKDFQYVEENKDQGVNVREKAKILVALLKDDSRLKNERIRALKARERFAQATSHVGNNTIRKSVKSEDYDDSYNPFDDDVISPGAWFASEFETARPQTVSEEELQLQLALAMSKEEAAQSERLKRNDDLRLQMALTESVEDFKRCQISDDKEKMSAVDDLLGIAVEQPMDIQQPEKPVDPWGVPVSTTVEMRNSVSFGQQWNALPTLSESDSSLEPSPWSSKSPSSDAWGPKPFDNGAESSEADHGDHLSSRDSIGFMQSEIVSSSPFDLLNMKKSISADSSFPNTYQEKVSSNVFLGANSELVDLDSLIDRRPCPVGNPFSTSSSNPFNIAKSAYTPTINELRAQSNMASIPAVTSFPADTSLPSTTSLVSNTDSSPANRVASPANNPFM